MPESEETSQPVQPAKPPRHTQGRLAYLAQNRLSLFGLFVAGVGLVTIVTFALFALLAPSTNPYFGIVGYLIVPSIFGFGLVLVPIGMLLKLWRWRRAHGAAAPLPRIDLNDPHTRRSVLTFVGFSLFIVLPVLGVSSYFGYEYTESTAFCGQICHTVMQPEATAHARSAHARVTCAECHIGAGASWFVKSKVTGVGQVLAVARNSYPRPIPPAIHNLRPARETCEQCHWPAQFFGAQLRKFAHHSPDAQNTMRVVQAVLKTGGADPTSGRVEGIHMHMVLTGRVEYVATDEVLQEIPWVKYTTPTGEERIYRSDGLPGHDPRPEGVVRQIDCMDCHNRGAHHFRSPQRAVDLYLAAARMDATLPFLKREAVEALARSYPDPATAEAAVEEALTRFYREQYPEVYKTRSAAVRQAAAAVAEIYRGNFFPEMNVGWRTYPENVGHLESAGCFRCHDGRHVNDRGEWLTADCTVCHSFVNPLDEQGVAFSEGAFRHSMSLEYHEKLRCDQCHTGGPLPTCRECHASGKWLELKGKGRFNAAAAGPGWPIVSRPATQ